MAKESGSGYVKDHEHHLDHQIKEVEEEIRKTPYNKATQAHIGRLKAKLAKLRGEAEKGSGKGQAPGFAVKKSGDATVLLVGFPSVGKSTLINKLTNAESKTADYDFTTTGVIPGMLEHNGAKIQMLDIPGMIVGASAGKGRGRQVLSVVRNADLILIIIDDAKQLEPVKKELYAAGMRLDEKRPDVKITKKETGGMSINIAVKKPLLDVATVRSILSEFKIHNADVLIRENATAEQLIDATMKNRVYVPSLVVCNKIDKMDYAGFNRFSKEMKNVIFISAMTGKNLEILRDAIWRRLEMVRIYMKPVGKEADMSEPLIMKRGVTITDAAEKILRGNAKNLRYGRIWGPSAKFGGQRVGKLHQLKDKDTVELHI